MMKTSIPLIVESLQGDGYHLFCSVKINRTKFLMVLDTGASRSVFDTELLQKYFQIETTEVGDKKSSSINSEVANSYLGLINELKIGQLIIPNYQAVMIDLAYVNDIYAQMELPPVIGILGCDILVPYNAQINLKKHNMSLSKPSEEI